MVHCISLAAGERLRRLAELYDLVWATGWEDRANDLLPTLLGLPELPYLTFDGAARFGIGPLEAGAARRIRERAVRWPGSTTPSTRAATSGRGSGRQSGDADPARSDRVPPRARGGPDRGPRSLGPRLPAPSPAAASITAVEGFWPIFFLLVVLKIPVLGSLWLVWWASKSPSEPGARAIGRGLPPLAAAADQPRGPRRGPHGGAAQAQPECPPGGRTRILTPPAPVRAGVAHARSTPTRRQREAA